MLTHALFLLFVAVGVYVQVLTGFALSLILLGLVGITNLLPVPDVANAVSVIAMANAGAFLFRRRSLHLDRSLLPAVAASFGGILFGMFMLTVLAHGAYDVLRLVLGVTIVGSAVLLWQAARPLDRVSSPRSFALVGSVSGVLGGMFSASGPPLAYLIYRQPWPIARIQQSLIIFFALGAVLRISVLASTGHFSRESLLLGAEAIPVVVLVTLVGAKRLGHVRPLIVKRIACLLLVVTGGAMIGSAASALIGA